MRRWLRGLIGFAGFLMVCEVVGRAGFVRQEYLPPPTLVAGRLVTLMGDSAFIADTLATLLAVLIALGLAAAIAVPAGLLLGSVTWLRRAVIGLVELLRPIPAVALIPLVLFVLGSGPQTKISLAVYAGIWPILFNVIYGIGETEPLLIDTARVFGCSRRRILTSVMFPSTAPFAATGVRMASAICLIVVLSTELLAPSSGGLGRTIFLASSNNQMDAVLAGTVVAGAAGAGFDAVFRWMQRSRLSWAERGDPSR